MPNVTGQRLLRRAQLTIASRPVTTKPSERRPSIPIESHYSVKAEAIKCRHCNEMLPGAVRPVASPAEKDTEHLRLLVLGHHVLSGVTALFACIPLIHLAIGLTIILAPEAMKGGK